MRISGLEGGLSARRAPQSDLAVSDVEATIGRGTAGYAGPVGVYVEDVENIHVTIVNSGPDAVAAGKVQGNDFEPHDTDSRWIDVPGAVFAAIAAGGSQTLTLQGKPFKWMRVRANTAAGQTAVVSLAWAGQ